MSAQHDAPQPTGAGLLHSTIDGLTAEFGGDEFREEIAAAREDYFERAGKVFEDDAEIFEARLAAFLEWYVLERPLRGGPPPVMQALERSQPGQALQDRPDRAALARLAASHHSLFDVAAVDGHTIELEDVIGGARWSVIERRSTIGFEPGDVIEARLVSDGQHVVFAKTFIFHPKEAREEVLEVIEGALAKGTPRNEIMFRLARLHVRWFRHGHAHAARVYKGG